MHFAARFEYVSRHSNPQRLYLGLTAVVLALLALAAAPQSSFAAPCDAPVTNPVLCENSKTGSDPSTWQIDKAGDASLQGYATSMSVNKGQTVSFKIKASSSNFHIDVYRLGYYGGDGARLQQQLGGPTGPTTTQPACQQFAASGLIDCGNWSVSASWNVPSTAVSGVYIAHLVNNSNPDIESHITFVVRDDSSQSSILVQTSDQTWQAYNTYGGNSLYQCTVACPPGEPSTYKAAYKVSYNRPFNTAEDDSGRSWLLSGGEYPMIRFLERNGYNVSYVSGIDVQSNASVLQNHKVFMSSGHDEYWAKQQRANVTAARNNGLNLAFFTGNEMFWKTRFEPSAAGTSTPNRTLVSYKDTHFPEQQDPAEWTGTWRDPRFPSDAADVVPENALTGQSFIVNSGTSQITVPSSYKNQRIWRNTTAGALTFPMGTLGYEWDEDPDNGFRPAGQIRMSSTTVNGVEVFTDYGSTTKFGGTATHNLTMYRAPGGARVFGSGTVQWSWGLDAENEGGVTPDRNMQQATVNLLADMGTQPGSLMSGIVGASASTDSTAPTATVTGAPATVADGTQVNISGTATDGGGGVVAGVEVSTDGGSTWHPATTGTTSWSYSWIAHGNPSTTIKVRATDDSGNLGNASAGTSVAVTCPCSIWGTNTSVPVDDRDSGDPTPVEVGVKFKSDKFGTISGLRFYKAATNTGTHVGTLWSESGQELAQASFSGESASGWQTVTFNSPVAVQPNTTYVASYHAPNGHYSATSAYFYNKPAPGPSGGAVVDSPPLHATRNSGTTVNGVYSYGAAGTFPVNSFAAGNYWVDVMFTPTRAAGDRDGRHRHLGRPALGERQLVGARHRRRRDLLPDHALRRLDRADRDDDHRQPAGHDDHDQRAHDRDDVHLQGRGHQSERRRPRLGGVQRRDPAHRRGTLGAAVGGRPGRDPVGARDLDCAADRRRQRDHGLHRDAVHRRGRADARPGGRVGHQRDDQRPHQRDELHVQGDRHQQRGHEPGRDLQRGGPAGDDLRPRDACHGRLGRRQLGGARREVQGRLHGDDQRRPLLQVVGQHGHPHRQPVVGERHAPRAGQLLRRERLGLAVRHASRARWP